MPRIETGDVRVLERDHPHAWTAILQAACAVRARGFETVGLVPAAPDVPVHGIARHLAAALALVTGRQAVVVGTPADGAYGGAHPGTAAAQGVFASRSLGDGVVLLLPREDRHATCVRDLADFLRERPPRVGAVVVDLTGFARSGEHLEVVALLDGTAVVARAGRTTSEQLERWAGVVPARRDLGVLLLNA